MVQLPKDLDLVAFAQEVYALSDPRGMGLFHFTPEPLSREEAEKVLQNSARSNIALTMDYVKGRACKMVVWKSEDGTHTIRNPWYDHTDAQLETLVKKFGGNVPEKVKHSPSCECRECAGRRGRVL